MRLRLLRPLAAVAILLLALVASPAIGAPGDPGGPPSPEHPAGPALGVVPPRSEFARINAAGAGSNLSYHNGPVMRANQVYAIYWAPSGYSIDTSYQTAINGFFQNVSAAGVAKSTSNVYYSDTQYSDTTGAIAYSSTFAGAIVDTTPYPPNGCPGYSAGGYSITPCLWDTQIQTEVAAVAKGMVVAPNTIFFVFTPKNVGSCFSGSQCAFTYFCAYHSWSGSTYYANMPYADTVPAACDAGQHPNNDEADATINVVSHEHNESITDPAGSAWFDRRGYEDGDKCAWNFGTALGNTGTGLYNQAIGTGKYYLQQEWSNKSSGCVLTGT